MQGVKGECWGGGGTSEGRRVMDGAESGEGLGMTGEG